MTVRRLRFPHHRKPAEPTPSPIFPPYIIERDDGMFEIVPNGAGPFPTRTFANAVWLQQARHASAPYYYRPDLRRGFLRRNSRSARFYWFSLC
jgi:hypothetical protein